MWKWGQIGTHTQKGGETAQSHERKSTGLIPATAHNQLTHLYKRHRTPSCPLFVISSGSTKYLKCVCKGGETRQTHKREEYARAKSSQRRFSLEAKWHGRDFRTPVLHSSEWVHRKKTVCEIHFFSSHTESVSSVLITAQTHTRTHEQVCRVAHIQARKVCIKS